MLASPTIKLITLPPLPLHYKRARRISTIMVATVSLGGLYYYKIMNKTDALNKIAQTIENVKAVASRSEETNYGKSASK